MSYLMQCLSHSPLKGNVDPDGVVVAEVSGVIERFKAEIEAFAPELVFVFAPDHYNGFFLDAMPQFCLGIEATSVGDYSTQSGPLNVPRELAEACCSFVVGADIDLAFSYRMQVDHGVVQPLEELGIRKAGFPVIPIFINSVAPPMVTCRRARLLGRAVGQFARLTGKRCMFLGSGGLSHNPPVPQIATAQPEFVEFLISGRNPTPDKRAARQKRTMDAARAFADGTSQLHPLNPEWDEGFIAKLVSKEWSGIDAYRNEQVTAEAGVSTHEVKSWVAANAAIDAATDGRYSVEKRYYRAIPEWIAGYGAMCGNST